MTRILFVRDGLAAIAFALLLACGIAFAQTAPDTSDAPASAQASLKLLRVIVGLPAGTPWLSLRSGAFCMYGPHVQSWNGDRAPQRLSYYSASFKTELEHAGFKVI